MAEERKHDSIQGEIVHEYDGILEADNLLPRWWLVTFYGAILFSAAYWFYYEAFAIGANPRARYEAILEERAANGGEVTEEMLVTLGADSSRVAAGQAIFATNCAVCHGQSGEGTIGPNLTDDAWLHGGTAMDIHHTIAQGVSTGGGGMPAWGQTLGPRGLIDVASFVLSIRGTNRPGRPPQGVVEGAGAPVEDGAVAEPTNGDAAPTEGADAAAMPEAANPEAANPEAGNPEAGNPEAGTDEPAMPAHPDGN